MIAKAHPVKETEIAKVEFEILSRFEIFKQGFVYGGGVRKKNHEWNVSCLKCVHKLFRRSEIALYGLNRCFAI